MNRFGKIAACLGGGLALGAGLAAQELSSTNHPPPDNPYALIAARNVFGLNPPAPPADPAKAAGLELPKITPNGIMSVYGCRKVLFKTSGGGGPGRTAREKFYDLAEGQTQDEIGVSRIDPENGLVTFDNHGVVQELALVSTPGTGEGNNANSGSGSAPIQFAGAHLRSGIGGPDPWRPGGPFNPDAGDGDGSSVP